MSHNHASHDTAKSLAESLAQLRLGILYMSGLIGECVTEAVESASAATGAAPPRVEYVALDPALRPFRVLATPDTNGDVIDVSPDDNERVELPAPSRGR